MKDLSERLEAAEFNGLKGGKRLIQKLEQKMEEVQAELDSEQRYHAATLNEVLYDLYCIIFISYFIFSKQQKSYIKLLRRFCS